MKTGLTDMEKESLLKFFLTKGELTLNEKTNVYEFKFFNDSTPCYLGIEKIILKAMDNLRYGN